MRNRPPLYVLLFAVLTACAGPPRIVDGPVYPASLPHGATLDIQVIRRGTKIDVTNTSAREFPQATLWLNQRYARTIPGLAVGETTTLHLGGFLDEFSQKFRAGGFFATEKPDRLALAELEAGGEIVGLIVIGGRDP